MGYSNPDSGCRRHPNQKQLPGICSWCLRERLSKLNTENNSYKTSNLTFSDSESESEGHSRHHSTVAPIQGSGSGDASRSSGKMKKSRSVAWASRALRRGNDNRSENDIANDRANKDEDEQAKTRKNGLWKKLVHSTSKKTKGVLMHSYTVRDRSQYHHHN